MAPGNRALPPRDSEEESARSGPGSTSDPAVPGGFRSGFVALAGRPNVGKSTLLNRLLGRKVSIVSPVPQTTRLIIRTVSRDPTSEIIYIDTPGLHKPRHRMNREMVRQAREALSGVDLLAVLIDGPEGIGQGDRYLFRLVSGIASPAFLVINKIDAMPRSSLLPIMAEAARLGSWEEIVPCSAQTGEGCAELGSLIRRRIPEGPPLFPEGFADELPLKLAVGERIREQVLLRTRQEVPHSTAVVVDRIEEPGPAGHRIEATIFVDRESQKGILIGRGGEMLKAIGIASRAELADFLGRPVHLSLWVKVKHGWREDPLILRLLGISSDV